MDEVVICISEAQSALAESLVHALREDGYEPLLLAGHELELHVESAADSTWLLDADAPSVIDMMLRAHREHASRTVMFASSETLQLSKMQTLVLRGIAGLFVHPVRDLAAVFAKLPKRMHRAPSSIAPPIAERTVQVEARPQVRPASKPPSRPPPSVTSRPPGSSPRRNVALPPFGIRDGQPSSLPPGSQQHGEFHRPTSDSPQLRTSASAALASPASLVLSAELAEFLADAEAKVGSISEAYDAAGAPSPEEEIANILPEDVLLALDLPVDEDDAKEFQGRAFASEGTPQGSMFLENPSATTSTGGKATSTQSQVKPLAQTPETQHAANETPALPFREAAEFRKPAGRQSQRPQRRATDDSQAQRPERAQESPRRLPPHAAKPSEAHNVTQVLLHPHDVAQLLGKAIAARETVTLTLSESNTEREPGRPTDLAFRGFRLNLQGGDIVAISATHDGDSLLDYLVERGDLLRAEVVPLRRKIPKEGRYAAAALVAHGFLKNDEIWDVLKAHCAWLLGRALSIARGVVERSVLDTAVSQQASMMGTQSGAALFIEAVRLYGGTDQNGSVFDDGDNRVVPGAAYGLLSECGLHENDIRVLHEAAGAPAAEIFERLELPTDEGRGLLVALTMLGVLDVLAVPTAQSHSSDQPQRSPGPDPLDDDARRARIRARAALVDEGDYFAVLGVSRDASGYEIRKAFLELRREFEPKRLMTPALLPLQEDVERIVLVLEESYDILRDSARRERYRDAIRSTPGGD
jgi:hypothetical protein